MKIIDEESVVLTDVELSYHPGRNAHDVLVRRKVRVAEERMDLRAAPAPGWVLLRRALQGGHE